VSAIDNLDGTDHEILDLLTRDARRTIADIAEQVSMSAPAVKRRIDRLESLGVITGYTTVVDHTKLGTPLRAFVELRFVGNTKVADIAGVAKGLREVDAVFTIAGDPDALVSLRVRDVSHLVSVIDQLRRTGLVTGTKTLMVLDTWAGHPQQNEPERKPNRMEAS
jgi:Lrp/AsnC family leucine-responsive transcriptional regulator